MTSPPTDSYHRRIDYLRLSITDRCNLRCTYCMPEEGVPKVVHTEILRYEEILRLARIVTEMGISKIRITGGEPLVRKDIFFLCENIARVPGLTSLSVTTNGVLLAEHAETLFKSGIKRINISLDTLQREKYAAITRHDCFNEVWEGIMAAREAGFSPIKLNTVVMHGVNDDEIEELGKLTYKYPFHIRFIEFMPFQQAEFNEKFYSADDILKRLSGIAELIPTESGDSNGPARHFRFPGAMGKVGIISPLSHHFCPTCNRLRLTADGKLRTCLFSTDETDVKAALRSGASDEDIARLIRAVIAKKPERHELSSGVIRKCVSRPMSAIGG